MIAIHIRIFQKNILDKFWNILEYIVLFKRPVEKNKIEYFEREGRIIVNARKTLNQIGNFCLE